VSESKPFSSRPSSGTTPPRAARTSDDEIGDDAELRDRLDALMAAYDQPPSALDRPLGPDLRVAVDATSFLTSPPLGAVPDDGPTVDQSKHNGPNLIDMVIADRYKIRQEIGNEGMGRVYLAEQLRPMRRMVALKLIKPGMDSRNVLARFESERQALAVMDHPHIARVLDAGTTEGGRPFFVMELVRMAVEVSGHPGAVREEGQELPRTDPASLRPPLVSPPPPDGRIRRNLKQNMSTTAVLG
jgi:hypothetical protein